MNKLIYSLLFLFSFHIQAVGPAAVFSGGAAVIRGNVMDGILKLGTMFIKEG